MLPTIAAARAGKRLLLANKEAIVCAGALLLEAVRAGGATLLPLDSEHNAIQQCLAAASARDGVRRLILTASGGPFRECHDFSAVTPEPVGVADHPFDAVTRAQLRAIAHDEPDDLERLSSASALVDVPGELASLTPRTDDRNPPSLHRGSDVA